MKVHFQHQSPTAMKTLLLLTTLAICLELNLAKYKTTTPKYPGRTTTTKSPEEIYDELLDTWDNPEPSLKEKITLTIKQYGYWASTTKFVVTNQKLQPTYVERFCKCKGPYGKRSLMTRVKRQKKPKPTGTQKKRMEWRTMSTKMRKAFIKHFNNLATKSETETTSRLEVFAGFHRKVESPGAYRGLAFLPWNREYLFRLENALTDDGYTGGMPYWDSGLDFNIGSAKDSAIFTTEELGATTGTVGKPLAQKTVSRDCIKAGRGATVQRFAKDTSKSLFSRQKYEDLPWKTGYSNFAEKLERAHGGVHSWFGKKSHMMEFNCVGFDPMFFLHHCYIDYIWEQYRKRQSVTDRETDYPLAAGKLAHHKYATMKPFDNKENIDGLKNQYTSVHYTYVPSPNKCKTDKSCKGALLWCHDRKCEGKVKKGGKCDRNISDNQCYCPKGKPACKTGTPPRCACD